MKRTVLERRTGLRRFTPLRRRRSPDRQLEESRQIVRARSDGRCEARLFGCTGVGVHAHHRLRRSQGGSHHPTNLLWVCWACHKTIHDYPAHARRAGLLLGRKATDAMSAPPTDRGADG